MSETCGHFLLSRHGKNKRGGTEAEGEIDVIIETDDVLYPAEIKQSAN